MNKKVGILTWHYYENVGSNLQAYALMKTIEKKGYNVEFINYQQKKLYDPFFKKILKILFSKFDNKFPGVLPNKYTFKSFSFQRRYFKTTPLILDKTKLNKLNNKFDIFICGSDQIWSPLVFDETYFLNFVQNKYKFSYAPSIGSNYIPETMEEKYIELLKNFNSISVREQKGKELLAKINIDSIVVLDPTFLLDKKSWTEIMVENKETEEYIFCYFLGNNTKHRKKVCDYAKEKGIKLIIYSTYLDDEKYCDERINKIGPSEFLTYLYHAEEIYTDSFHGVALSIKFEKKFTAFYRFMENDLNNQNSRIINILNILELKHKLISDDEKLNVQPIDYKTLNEKLDRLIKESMDFLNGELKNGEIS